MREAVTRVFATLFTVPPAVLHGDRFLRRTTWLIPLMIITVLLMISLTVSISLSRATTPNEKLNTSTILNALIRETGIVTTGTRAVS